MIVRLHKQARTTPAVRAEIQATTGTHVELATRYNVSVLTIAKWRKRDSVEDRSHTAHRLQTTLLPAQEQIVVELRKTLKLGLDDLLVVVRGFLNPHVSRSGLDRCLRRHGVGNLRDLEPAVSSDKPQAKSFKHYEPGYVHIDVKYLHADVLTLEWAQVDLERRVVWFYGDQMKNKLDHHVSLNDTAMEVLCRQVGKHASRVFTYNGNPIANANTGVWCKGLAAVGIENFRWHDLRHCWASWLVQNGTPLYAVQEMGGWKSVQMVQRYAHLSPANLAHHAQTIDHVMAHGTISSQSHKE